MIMFQEVPNILGGSLCKGETHLGMLIKSKDHLNGVVRFQEITDLVGV